MIYIIIYFTAAITAFLFMAWADDSLSRYDKDEWFLLIAGSLLWPAGLVVLLAAGMVGLAKYLSRRGTTDRARMRNKFKEKRDAFRSAKLAREREMLRRHMNDGTLR